MKYSKLILIGALVASSVVPTQAAVYGTLKQDMYFSVDTDAVKKPSGTGISILEQDGDNFLIKVSDESTELVNKNFVKLAGIISKTTVENAKVNAKADPASEVMTTLGQGEMVMVLEKANNYYKIKIDNTVGYIYKSQIEVKDLEELEKDSSEALGEEIVAYAKKYLGGRYVFGGNNLNTGVDCSGFVQQVYKQFDVNLDRSSRSQYASNGSSVKKADLKPGDLVFYGYSSVNHVAIYIGDGKIVHAPVPGKTVCVAPLWQRGDADIIGYKRIFM